MTPCPKCGRVSAAHDRTHPDLRVVQRGVDWNAVAAFGVGALGGALAMLFLNLLGV